MTIQLSTSDYVSIVLCALQIIVSIALAAWAMKKSEPTVANGLDGTDANSRSSFFLRWFKSSWLFLIFCAYAFFQIWQLAESTEVLSKSYVVRLVLLATYGALNAVSAIGFFIVEFQLDITHRLALVVKEITAVQGDLINHQQKSLEVSRTILSTRLAKKKRKG